MNEISIKKTLSMLGLAKKAGKLISGSPMVCEEISRNMKIRLIVYSLQASDNSKKRICDKAAFYKVPIEGIDVEPDLLAKSVGKSGACAAVGVADAGFAKAIIKIINS